MGRQAETVNLVTPLRNYMEHRGWQVFKTWGNAFHAGWPDLYAIHPEYSPKWIECKMPSGIYTPAQRALFKKWILCNVRIWVVQSDDLRGEKNKYKLKECYNTLFREPNGAQFLLKGI